MFQSWLRRRRSPQVLHPDGVIFRGEQDGVPEQQLKYELTKVFESRSDVELAYLAIVSYQDGLDHNVALCVTGVIYPDRQGFVNDINKVVGKMLPANQHLDILFASTTQQAQLEQVCRPFFARGPSD